MIDELKPGLLEGMAKAEPPPTGQPMGFFTANTLAGEGRRRGVQILPVDINASGDKCVAVTDESVEVWRCGSMEKSGSYGPSGNPPLDAPLGCAPAKSRAEIPKRSASVACQWIACPTGS